MRAPLDKKLGVCAEAVETRLAIIAKSCIW
jgi:hypothetical protein